MNQIVNKIKELGLSDLSIPQLGLNSIIDILIVAFISYKVLIWVKETRAWALFKGIGVILIVFFIADKLKFYTVSWIITNTLNVGITLAIVIFQPELRKALEQIGKGRYIQMVNREAVVTTENDQKSIDEVIEAAFKMAKVKTGALMVIEQKVKLPDIINTGIRIEGLVSSQLLINIFENKTPLHDGAVIINRDRVEAASCILPLTPAEVSSDLGTRHRAAIGMSEVCDAYIVVVSEETGAVSVASGGKLFRNLSQDEIRDMLSNDSDNVKKKTLWRWRKRNG